jgi:hypothetical protein
MTPVTVFGHAIGGIAYAVRLDEVQDLAAAERLGRLAEKYEHARITPGSPSSRPRRSRRGVEHV